MSNLYEKLILGAALLVSVTTLTAATTLSDTPLAVTSLAKSNVVFTLDNSGGVDVDVLLPTFNSLYIESKVTASTTTASNTNGFFYLFPSASIGARLAQYTMGFADSSNPDPLAWRAYYYGYNTSYYNPNILYKPWLGKDNAGIAFANATATAVRLDPYLAGGATYDITVSKTYTAYTYLKADGSACNNSGCSSQRTYNSTIYPASYYIWKDANNNGTMEATEGVLYQIKSTNTVYPSGRTYAVELQNFANWFQYYRTPYLAFKGALGLSLTVMSSARVGVTDLGHTTPNFPVADMSVAANLSAVQAATYGIATTPGDWTQPIHERLQNVWNYYNLAANATNPPAPVQYACQQNFNVLVSPGYLNESSPWKNNHTGVTPSAISPTNFDGSLGAPYADTFSDTLGDWAGYYYAQRLRTDLAAGQVPLAPNTQESNSNLHMTTYVLAPGAVPLTSTLNPGTPLANAQTVNLFPPNNTPITWPAMPCFVCQSTIDDMWHAAVDGRGIFVNSSNIVSGLGLIVDDILSRIGAAAAVAVNNANVVQGNNFSYASSYTSGAWSGDLQSYPIDLTSGALMTTSPAWSPSAQGQLDLLAPSARKIATHNGTTGIPFQWASMNATMKGLLNSPTTPPGPSDGASVLAFLRGDRTNEGTIYRTRNHVLADIVDAEPVVVLPPSNGYVDSGYSSFIAAKAARSTMVYQGANDGMLHAFVAGTGAEAWAYVPGLLFNSRLSSYPNTSTLANLTVNAGFYHLNYVDATATVGDVNFSSTLGGAGLTGWRSLLVGGLGNGGRGFYALDVTDPVSNADGTPLASESDVASKALWEYPNAGTPNLNMGFGYGKPIIAKTKATGWVVLVASGYNNGSTTGGDGAGHLFVLDPANGSLLADISTGVGSSGAPSGLANLSAYVRNSDIDNTTEYVYGGDLLGNVWRFDLSGASIGAWKITKLASLVDASGNAQPITSAPEIGVYQSHRFIYVGTGQYLGAPDISTVTSQTIYGLIDDQSLTPLITPLRSNLLAQTLSTGTSTRTDTSIPMNFATQKGWYIDLPGAGERIVTDPSLGLGVLTVTSNTPGTDPCSPGGSSFEYFIDYKNGGAIVNSTVAWTGQSLGSTLGSRPLLIKIPTGKLVSLVRQSNTATNNTPVPIPPASSQLKRIFWREIMTQ